VEIKGKTKGKEWVEEKKKNPERIFLMAPVQANDLQGLGYVGFDFRDSLDWENRDMCTV
jgi:hypothetical protein